jgi:hypothetical protein
VATAKSYQQPLGTIPDFALKYVPKHQQNTIKKPLKPMEHNGNFGSGRRQASMGCS